MSKKYKKSTINQKNQTQTHNILLVPLILILAVVPLIARSHTYDSKLGDYPWFSVGGSITDIFLYWKSIIFVIISFIIAGIIIYELSNEKKKIKFTPIFIPLGIYAILSFLSSLASKYSYFSFHGIYEQFESIWVLLGYCLVTYYAFLFINTEKDLQKVFRWFMAGIVIISLIGLSQSISHDFYRTTFGKMTFLPSSAWDTINDVTFNFEASQVYMSLYNPNYVGIYVGLVAPIFLVLILFNKNLKHIIGYITLLLVLLICLFASQSRSGLISLVVSLIFMVFLFRKWVIKQWKPVLAGVLLIISVFFIMNFTNNNLLLNRVSGIFHNNTTTTEPVLSEIQTNNDNVTIVYNKEPLVIRFDSTNLQFDLTDKSGNKVDFIATNENYEIAINDSRFSGLVISPANLLDYLGFLVRVGGKDWYFTNQSVDGTYYHFTKTGKLDKINNSKTMLFAGKEDFASKRGYIWSRTIPLLSNKIILGSGADTFPIVYPNNDYVGKYNYGYEDTIITKPHCMYLQIAVQTGILSLIAFLVFFGMYFTSSIKLYLKHNFDTYMSQIGAAILVGTTGYMIAGIANDSTITVAPVFWALIGIGLAINHTLYKSNL